MAYKEKVDHRQAVTDKLIELLESGTAPFQIPWDAESSRRPYNPTTDKAYRGANSMWLSFQGYSDPRWMTYKQAEAAGWQVRKGQKSSSIEYWKFRDEQSHTDSDGITTTVSAELERPRVFHANVFNARQIDGIPPLERTDRVFEWEPNERTEEILKASKAVILHDQANSAYYSPLRDEVHLPQKDQFHGTDEYYGTVLHELGHWSGHESRLNRQYGVFGGEEYAREELRAEIASWIMADTIGVPHNPENSAAYVKSWVATLKKDKNEIFRASTDAEAISTFVFSFSPDIAKEIDKVLSVNEINAQNLLDRIARSSPENIYGDADIIAEARLFLEGKPELTPEVAEILRHVVYGSYLWVDIQRDTRQLLNLPELTDNETTQKTKAQAEILDGQRVIAEDDEAKSTVIESEPPIKLITVTPEQRSALTQFIIRGRSVEDFGNSLYRPSVQAPEAIDVKEVFGPDTNAVSITVAFSNRKGRELLNDFIVSAKPVAHEKSNTRAPAKTTKGKEEPDGHNGNLDGDNSAPLALVRKRVSRKQEKASNSQEL